MTLAGLDRLLEESAELLLDADTQTVLESLERREAPDAHEASLLCDWCNHTWHGLACAPPEIWVLGPSFGEGCTVGMATAALTVDGLDHWTCRCSSSRERLDDTWRPTAEIRFFGDSAGRYATVLHAQELSQRMDATGLDGYALEALFEEPRILDRRSLTRLRQEIRRAVMDREAA